MSSPSIFYVLNEVEKDPPRPGNNILMMTFGSGFKVNTMVLKRVGRTNNKRSYYSVHIRSESKNIIFEIFDNDKESSVLMRQLSYAIESFDVEQAVTELWRSTLGLKEISVEPPICDESGASVTTALVKELYTLLVPDGNMIIGRELVETDGVSHHKRLREIKEHICIKYKSAPRHLRVA